LNYPHRPTSVAQIRDRRKCLGRPVRPRYGNR